MNVRAAGYQAGSALVVSLLMLMVMTVLGLAASQAIRTHERLAAAVRDRDVSFQSTEAALRAAERLIDLTSASHASCTEELCQIYESNVLGDNLAFQSPSWWDAHSWAWSEDDVWTSSQTRSGDAELLAQPRFVVEEFENVPDSLTLPPTGPPPSRMYYRITAADHRDETSAPIVLQSIFSRRFN